GKGAGLAVWVLLSNLPRRRTFLFADSDSHPWGSAALHSLAFYRQSHASAAAQGNVRPAHRARTFHKTLSPRHVRTTRTNSCGESRRSRDDPGRHSHATSVSRTIDANRSHGRHK